MAARRRDALRLASAGLASALALACGDEPPRRAGAPAGWPIYGGDSGGSRYSPLDEIDPANVGHLEIAWEYHTGDLPEGLPERRNHAFQATPILMGETLYFCTPRSRVVALDAETGAERWVFDPRIDLSVSNLNCRGVASWRDAEAPPGAPCAARASWEGGSADRTGAANVWSIGSADPQRDLVFLPTSSPSPDFYGGERLGENRWADSVVALRGSTGALVWAFQTVHHDLWDYDLASQPVLIDFPTPSGPVPAVVQATKMGNLFVLHRETGEPLVPVRERPVARSTVPGERSSATQPFPEWPPPLAPQGLRPDQAFGLTPFYRARCRERIAALRSEGVFTPPSFEGSVVFPGTAGGSNWGSVAWDPERRLLVANTTRIANTLRLIPRAEPDPPSDGESVLSTAQQEGTPYKAVFGVLVSPWGIPCNPPPSGALSALDLEERELRWEVPLGTTRDLAPLGIALPWGVPNMGGPIATASGLVFVAASFDDYLRAFASETGEELWRGRLPAGGQATPMTYRVRAGGRQLVVVAAGGHASMRTRRGDSLVAFALP